MISETHISVTPWAVCNAVVCAEGWRFISRGDDAVERATRHVEKTGHAVKVCVDHVSLLEVAE